MYQNNHEQDYYAILGITRSATLDDIKKAYRQSALQWHPDKHQGNPEAEARFKYISEAYQILSDPQKRHIYDLYGTTEMNNPRETSQWTGNHFNFGFSPHSSFVFQDPFELFEQFFDSMNSFSQFGRTDPFESFHRQHRAMMSNMMRQMHEFNMITINANNVPMQQTSTRRHIIHPNETETIEITTSNTLQQNATQERRRLPR